MQVITVVALLCHAIAGISAPVCREEIIAKGEMPMQACLPFPPALAEWKENSIYRGDQWTIARVTCESGDYVPRDAI